MRAILVVGVVVYAIVKTGGRTAGPLSGSLTTTPAPLQSTEQVAHAEMTPTVEAPPAGQVSMPGSGRLKKSGLPIDWDSLNDPDTPQISAPTTLLAALTDPNAPAPAVTVSNDPVPSVVELQPFRDVQTIRNARGDTATLTNLNKYVGICYLLEVTIAGQKTTLNLETTAVKGNPLQRAKLSLYPDGIEAELPGRGAALYPLWSSDTQTAQAVPASSGPLKANLAMNETPLVSATLQAASHAAVPFTTICDGAVLVRTQKSGASTMMETTTDLLRSAPLGDWLVETLKPHLIPNPETATDSTDHTGTAEPALGPGIGLVDAEHKDAACVPPSLGIANDAPDRKMAYGHWYRATHHPGTYVSVMKPSIIDKQILDSYRDRVAALGSKGNAEAFALVYLVAFDMSQFRFRFVLGAEHPKLDWSQNSQSPHTTKGPDGFDTRQPLVTIGAIPPYDARYAVAAFAGGFKRQHGAFKSGALSKVNLGSHFGFAEKGVLFSRLHPGLATACISREGMIDLVTWPENAPAFTPTLMDARQNCVPIIEGVDADGKSIPGALVNKWGDGAWSGSQAGDFTSNRAGMGIQESNGKSFLIVAYFTGATPNAMARVFQSYGCRYAMILDMNSISYCYTALYTRDDQGKVTGAEYLHKDMVNTNGSGGKLRFLETDDTRDFFYVVRMPDDKYVTKR